MTDHLGNQWSWTYDSLGRLRQKNDPDAGITTYTYDDAGRVLTQTDAKGQPTTFTYDSVGRLASKNYRGSNGGGATETVTFTRSEARAGFFNKGEVTTITAPLTTLTMNFDALGRAINQTRVIDGTPQGGSIYTYTMQNRFDALGRLLGTTYPDGDVVGSTANPLTYDSAGRLKGIPGIVNGVTYDAAGRPLVLTNANGTTSTRTYTAERGFLTQIQTLAGRTQVQSQSYTNDALGKVTQVISPFANETWTYDYDDLNRLISATSSVNPTNNQTFQYDEIGRITFNSKVGNYTYPSIGSPRPHAPTSAGPNTYAYDANGNMTSGADRTMTWNGDNRITSVVKAGTTSQYLYDGFGERLVQLAGSTASFYPFGDDYEVRGTTVTKYITAPGLGVIAKRVGPTTYWMHTDRLGSIESITTSTGAVALRRTYTPYGNKIADTGTHGESRGWIDQRQDTTGLTYLHARYYDGGTGIFLSPDPTNPRHPFVYGFGDPLNSLDRSGLDPTRPVFEVEVVACAPVPRPGCPNYWDFISTRQGTSDIWYTGHGFEENAYTRMAEKQQRREDRCLIDPDSCKQKEPVDQTPPTPSPTPTPTPTPPVPFCKTHPQKCSTNPDKLATKKLLELNKLTEKSHSEQCFGICKEGNQYFLTSTFPGDSSSCTVFEKCPAGSTSAGRGHTHTALDEGGYPGFGPTDNIGWPYWDPDLLMYLGVDGGVLRFDSRTGEETWLVPPSPNFPRK